MNDGVSLEVRLNAQELKIYELRARLAESEKRVAQKDARIMRLERKLDLVNGPRQNSRQRAEAKFNAKT